MSTTAEIPCTAEIRHRSLAAAIRKICGDAIHVVIEGSGKPRGKPRRMPLVCFREAETGTPVIPQAHSEGIAYALVLSPASGDYPMPPGVSELLTRKTPRQLGEAVLKKIQELRATAEQRIFHLEPHQGHIEVLFLDGQRFRLPTDRKHAWTRVVISPDRRYLSVPIADGEAFDTIPWDAIRKPQSHIAEEERTKRLLAETLRRFREESGFSQETAAKKSGLSRKTVNRLEKAGNYPGVSTLESLARAYGTTLPDLLSNLRAHSPR